MDRSDIMKKFLFSILTLLISFNVLALDIKSENVILYNLDENKVLFELNSRDRISVASMTKIMTALVALEKIDDLNKKVVITYDMVKGLREQNAAVVGFEVGEKVTYYDLLYAMLLPSGADGAQGLAVSTYGSVENFVLAMNKKAKELGLVNTHFANPIGLDDEENYSSVEDISIILKEALKNDEFKKAFSTNKYISSNKRHIFISTRVKNNYDTSFLDGSKTGFTYDAGLCLASTSHYNHVNFLLVTARAPYADKLNHFYDAYNIYNYYFNNYSERIILKKNEKLASINLPDKRIINLYSDSEIKKYIRNSCVLSSEYDGINVISKDIDLGDKIGEYIIKCDDEVIYKKDVYLQILSVTDMGKKDVRVHIIFSLSFVILILFIFFVLRRR